MALRKGNKLFKISRNYQQHRRKREISTGNASLYKILLPDSDMRGLGRAFWLFSCLLSAGVCVIQLRDRINYFFKTPIMTQVLITQGDAGRFPPVTICPVAFKKEFTTLLKFALVEACMYDQYCDEFVEGKNDRLYYFPLDLLGFTMQQFWKRNGINDNYVEISASCAGIADKSICTSGKEITVNSTFTDTILGRCVTYTLENDVEYNGASTFLEFVVSDHRFTPDPVEDSESHDIFYFIPLSLLNVVHQSYYAGKTLVKNQQTDIIISSKQFEFLNLQNRPCDDENTVIQCRINCFTRKFEQSLPCSLPFVNSTILKPCSTGNSLRDAYIEAKLIYRGTSHDECKCNQMCKERVYDSVIDVAPSQWRKANETLFTFYFADNNNEVVRETFMYTFAALLSDIAGNVGFFLGLSVLRALEVLVHLFTYVGRLCKSKLN